MAGETIITVVGNLTADPEIRTVGNGSSVASFTIASTPRTWNRNTGQFEDGQALFMRCSAWRDMAEHCAQSLSKGMRVVAQGRLQQRSYQANDGSQRTVIELQVDEIGPSLRYATAQVTQPPVPTVVILPAIVAAMLSLAATAGSTTVASPAMPVDIRAVPGIPVALAIRVGLPLQPMPRPPCSLLRHRIRGAIRIIPVPHRSVPLAPPNLVEAATNRNSDPTRIAA